MLETIFWSATILIVYTYIGYPAVIWLLARKTPDVSLAAPDRWPSVAVIIAAYNEEKNLVRRIQNLRELKYPGELRIVFSLDGCDDGSEAILRQYPDVEVIAHPDRRGKPAALNRAVERQQSDVLVFTDARQTVAPEAIEHLVRRLQDPNVGAVSGELSHYDAKNPDGSNIGLYWKYERMIRAAESRVYSVFGVTGALYAIRRSDFSAIAEDTILDDFQVPIQILRRGKRSVLESGAKVYDTLEHSIDGEKRRKIRTLTGNFQAFDRNRWLFNPSLNPGFWLFLSHKVFRLVMPYCLITVLLLAIFLDGPFYKASAALQIAFYAFALAGRSTDTIRQRSSLFSFPTTFVELNSSAVVALVRYLRGHVDARWEKT